MVNLFLELQFIIEELRGEITWDDVNAIIYGSGVTNELQTVPLAIVEKQKKTPNFGKKLIIMYAGIVGAN